MFKKYIICDIDGTIADIKHRLHYIQDYRPRNYDDFYNACDIDKPIHDIINLLRALATNHNIIYCTGRSETVRDKTKVWLDKHVGVHYTHLLMRKKGYNIPDRIAKPNAIKEAGIAFSDVVLVLEDRNSVVQAWRSLGITCIHVLESQVYPSIGDF